MLTQEKLEEILSYNPETGLFTRLVGGRGPNNRVGDISGAIGNHGYIAVTINRKRYLAHRLAWFITYGSWPKNEIDHLNHVRVDNRLANLRETTRQENMRNASLSKASTSGVTGVYWNKRDEIWNPAIMVNGKTIHLGAFTDKFEAICARKSAENKYGFHANHGKILMRPLH